MGLQPSSANSLPLLGGVAINAPFPLRKNIRPNPLSLAEAQPALSGTRSPLRYPGGKTRAISEIFRFIPAEIKTLCSPFLGGASVELACSRAGVKVFGYDAFSPLVDFWREAIEDVSALADCVEKKFFGLSREDFYRLQKTASDLPSRKSRAGAFFALNRASFSGTTLSGGMSPGTPRFTASSIARLRALQVSGLKVECLDFHDSIARHADDFLYLDPPYMIEQALYGRKGDTHKGFDHRALADILRARDNWILSYNNDESVRNLYHGYAARPLLWAYGMSKHKQCREILILSHDIASRFGQSV